MGKLIYSAIASLDGYVADESGDFSWAQPDESVHSFINGLERSVGTYLLGRRMYEVMAWWDTPDATEGVPRYIEQFANQWRAADKVVYSSTLTEVSTPKARLERTFDAAAIQRLKKESERDVSIGGPTLAAGAIDAGLVDEFQLYIAPVIVGGGLKAFSNGEALDLELIGERRFENGFVYLNYAPRR